MIERKFFFLDKDCFLVRGFLRGALYNLKTGNVYSINATSLRLLELCTKKKVCLEKVFSSFNGQINKQEIIDYFHLLQEKGIGRFYDIRKEEDKANIFFREKLNFLWLELTSNCNLRCCHCYNPSGLNLNKKNNIGLLRLKKVISEAKDLGCRKIQFTGGEPFLRRRTLYSLIEYSRKVGYKMIEIFTNATLLNKYDINYFTRNGIHIATSFYSINKKIHEQVTQIIGSYQRTLKNIKKLQRANIPLRVIVVGMNINQTYLEETTHFLKEKIGIEKVEFSIINPFGRGSNSNLITKELRNKLLIKKSSFSKIYNKDFLRRHQGHNCYLGHLCISYQGDVLPCVMERELIIGNIKNESLKEIWNSPIAQDLKYLSKDKIKVCQDCEYRYACFDCRARVRKETGDLYAKPPNCPYNPYTGQWEHVMEN